MSKSLQDQLLNAGLIDNKKAKKISKENRKSRNEKIRSKTDSVSETQAAVQKAQQEKSKRDRELNQKLKLEAEKKALAAQVTQLIQHYRLKRGPDSELDYNFSDDNKIKKIRVSAKISEEIIRGRLCIARLGETYEIIPKPIADKICERDTQAIVVYNTKAGASTESDSESDDDYYAQFEIPDDLTW